MHSLILRQLRKAGLSELAEDPKFAKFLQLVNDAYDDATEDRRQLEHSLSLASEEVYARNRQLEQEIAQRALLRQRLDDTTHYAAESERKYHALFELSPVGIIAADLKSGRIVQINDALAGLTGFSREALQSMHYADVAADDSLAMADVGSQDEVARPQVGPYETQFRRSDGSQFTAMVSGIRTTELGGGIVFWAIVQDISQRKAFELELAEAARRDKLTGLANRLSFMERLEQSLGRMKSGEQSSCAVLFLDFDRFKLVNDTLGHEAGDDLLRQISARLRWAVHQGDMTANALAPVVSRFGGDEFLVLVNDIKSGDVVKQLVDRLLSDLTPAYEIRGREVHSTASIGVVTTSACDSSAEELVRNADLAMYEAKRGGRARAVVFNEEMHTRLARSVAIESGLRHALGTDQLQVHYQPIVSLSNSQLVSAEALLRWTHPTLGVVNPAEFIPIAEESGLIVELGRWVQRQACRALVNWRRQDPTRAPLTVSVNISPAELALGERLVVQIRDLLIEFDLIPQCLQLEITEREFVRRQELAEGWLRELQQLGVRIAMDDFGTGMSSLGFLRSAPFDVIKIDRSFVQDLTNSPDGLAVIHAAVNLIENLGMESVAEGIEESSQVAILQSLGCRYAQGFLFSRAVAAEQLLQSVHSETVVTTQKLPTMRRKA